MNILSIGAIAIGWVFATVSWIWVHLQSGPLVAVLLIFLVLNMRVGRVEAVYTARIEDLEERVEELESGSDSADRDDEDYEYDWPSRQQTVAPPAVSQVAATPQIPTKRGPSPHMKAFYVVIGILVILLVASSN